MNIMKSNLSIISLIIATAVIPLTDADAQTVSRNDYYSDLCTRYAPLDGKSGVYSESIYTLFDVARQEVHSSDKLPSCSGKTVQTVRCVRGQFVRNYGYLWTWFDHKGAKECVGGSGSGGSAASCNLAERETRTRACPSGQTGVINEYRTKLPNECRYSSWNATSDNCAIPCSLAASETRTVSCPAGQTGSITEKRDRISNATTCSFGGWYPTQNTCVSTCTLPASETRTLSCSPGEVGSLTQIREKLANSCSFGDWRTTQGNCQACPIEATQRAVSCAPGEVGQIQQTRSRNSNAKDIASCYTPWVNQSSNCVKQVQYCFIDSTAGGEKRDRELVASVEFHGQPGVPPIYNPNANGYTYVETNVTVQVGKPRAGGYSPYNYSNVNYFERAGIILGSKTIANTNARGCDKRAAFNALSNRIIDYAKSLGCQYIFAPESFYYGDVLPIVPTNSTRLLCNPPEHQ